MIKCQRTDAVGVAGKGDHANQVAMAPGQPLTLIVPKGKFAPGLILELLHGERSRCLRLTEFLEQGKDFDRCAFQWQAEAR